MAQHNATGTIHFEEQDGSKVAVATITCSCGHTTTSQHLDDPDGLEAEQIAENAAWDAMTLHLGHDPRDVEVGPENTDNEN